MKIKYRYNRSVHLKRCLLWALASALDLHLNIHQLVTSSNTSTQHTTKVPDEVSAQALKHLGPVKSRGSSFKLPSTRNIIRHPPIAARTLKHRCKAQSNRIWDRFSKDLGGLKTFLRSKEVPQQNPRESDLKKMCHTNWKFDNHILIKRTLNIPILAAFWSWKHHMGMQNDRNGYIMVTLYRLHPYLSGS